MLDRILIEDLAASPPQIWSRRIKQAEVIAPLAKLARLNADDVERACAELAISRRQFFNLLKAHRCRLEGGPIRGNATGVHFHLEESKERVIEQAISQAGAAARYTEVLRLAENLAREKGVEPPSETSVRTRFCKPRAGIDLVKRLKLVDCRFVADICALELGVLDHRGRSSGAWLIAVIDTDTGGILHHEIFAGKPLFAQALGVLGMAYSCERERRQNKRIGLTSGLFDLNLLDLSFLNQTTTVMASETRKLVGSSAIRAVWGRSLGRIPIRNERSCWSAELPPTVPLAAAQQVVTHIVTHLHPSNYSACASLNISRTLSTAS